ncbi:MAG: hypothetical protein ABIH35_04630 [Patescibacteria group bacterium]
MFRKRQSKITPFGLALSALAIFAVGSYFALFALDTNLNYSSRAEDLPKIEIQAREQTPQPKLVSSKVIAVKPASPEIDPEERNWQNAERALASYFGRINTGDYTGATAVRTTAYLPGTAQTYAAALRDSKENDIDGDISVTDLERIESESKTSTKVFRLTKSAVWTADQVTHGDTRKVYLVLREGEWKIDYFEIERKF